jgi:hypothetical protein
MGCVWQSDYAPGAGADGARVQYRQAARHRKPPLWRRAAQGVMPLFAVGGTRYRPEPGPGRAAVARGR